MNIAIEKVKRGYFKNKTEYNVFDLNSFYDMPIAICDADCNSWPVAGTIVVSKSRRIVEDVNLHTHTLLPLDVKRHYSNIQQALNDNIKFKDKIATAVWRGGTTGASHCWTRFNLMGIDPIAIDYKRSDLDIFNRGCARWNLVVKYAANASSMVNVGLSSITFQDDKAIDIYSRFKAPDMKISDFLKYRYIISVEGNDVATGLKWSLATNSVVMMPKPRVETIFREGKLEPWIHYVPLADDLSDLMQMIMHCENRKDKCESIAIQGREFVRKFASFNIYEWGVIAFLRHVELLLRHKQGMSYD